MLYWRMSSENQTTKQNTHSSRWTAELETYDAIKDPNKASDCETNPVEIKWNLGIAVS